MIQIKDGKLDWAFFESEKETPNGKKVAATKNFTLYQRDEEYIIFNDKRNFEIVGHGCETLGDCIVYISQLENRKGRFDSIVKELVATQIENAKLRAIVQKSTTLPVETEYTNEKRNKRKH